MVRWEWIVAVAVLTGGCGPDHRPSGPQPQPAPAAPAPAPEVFAAVPLDAQALQLAPRAEWRSDGVRVSYPGGLLKVRFVGTAARVRLFERSRDTDRAGHPRHSRYAVFVDGQLHRQFDAAEGIAEYVLAEGLPDREHVIEVFRESEAWLARAALVGLELSPRVELHPVVDAARRIEVVGGSAAAGFGIGGSGVCAFNSSEQNHRLSFGAVLARAVDADLRSVVATGVGVTRNYDPSAELVVRDIYERIHPDEEAPRWTDDGWDASAVVISVGASDFASGAPDAHPFIAEYERLLERLRRAHPRALLVATVDPVLTDTHPVGGEHRTLATQWIAEAVQTRLSTGDDQVVLIELPEVARDQQGCDAHPNADWHQAVATQLRGVLETALGWTE